MNVTNRQQVEPATKGWFTRCSLQHANVHCKRKTKSVYKYRCELWDCPACTEYRAAKIRARVKKYQRKWQLPLTAGTLEIGAISPNADVHRELLRYVDAIRQIATRLDLHSEVGGYFLKMELAKGRRKKGDQDHSILVHIHFTIMSLRGLSLEILEECGLAGAKVSSHDADEGWIAYMVKPVLDARITLARRPEQGDRHGLVRWSPHTHTKARRALRKFGKMRRDNNPFWVGGLFDGHQTRQVEDVKKTLMKLPRGSLAHRLAQLKLEQRRPSYRRWKQFEPHYIGAYSGI